MIEILVVIAIIGVLVALLIPAVQAARETARQTSCKSHLSQIGLAVLQHEAAYRRLPSNGWSFLWVGDPDRGTGARQPGGWIFNILPYLEQEVVHDLPKVPFGPARLAASAEMVQKSLEAFNCPTRRAPEPLPYNRSWLPRNADATPLAAKSDYAINSGDVVISSGVGPYDFAQGDSPTYPWQDFSAATGVAYMRSEVKLAMVRDGQSNTYLAGEKYVRTAGADDGDDLSMYIGNDSDIARWTAIDLPPRQDGPTVGDLAFGSAHSGVCNFVMCDGSVRSVAYAIDAEIHRRLGNRADGLPVE